MSRAWLLFVVGTLSAAACAASDSLPPTQDAAGAGGGPIATAGAGGMGASPIQAGGGGRGGGGIMLGGSGGGAVELDSLIYAHTDEELFELNAKTEDLALKSVGKFDCIGQGTGDDVSMTDLAVDRERHIWGVSAAYVYRIEIDNGVAHCAEKIKLKKPSEDVRYYGLTFAPVGVLDPDKEVLVAGNTAGELWAVSEDGSVKMVGTFGNVPKNDGNGHAYDSKHQGKSWELSGDIVFLANEGSPLGYATVRDCPDPPKTTGCNATNTLIEIDVKKMGTTKPGSVTKSVRGQIVERAGCKTPAFKDFGNMFGIAAWDDKVYGFSRSGNLVDINVSDGSGCVVKAYPPADFAFAGAGVTTLAPVLPPPPK